MVFNKEKSIDKALMLNAMTEYCDHSNLREDCPVGELCFKKHKRDQESHS